MDMKLLNKNRQLELLVYKLLNDLLFLWFAVFLGLFIAEGAVPGYFSAYLSFTRMVIILFIILYLTVWLGRRNKIAFEILGEKNVLKNKTILFLLLVSFVLIINSLRGSGLFNIIITALAIAFILWFFSKTLVFSDKK